MTLEGANNFSENNSGTIFTMNGNQTGQYCVVVPKNTDSNINMLVDLNMKKFFDSLVNNTIDKDSLVKEINDIYEKIITKYPNSVLVLPMIDIDELSNSINSNDKQKMFDETKKIGSITSEVYQKLSNAGVDKSKVDQKIIIVEKTEIDNKFVNWLEEQMPNFVDGVSYSELSGNNVVNDEPVQAVDEVFGTSTDEVKQEVEVSPDVTSVDNSNNVVGDEVVSSETETATNDVQSVVEPQPIVDTKLDVTQTVPNVEDVKEDVVNSEEEVTNELDKKSGGFANLLILVVVLAVVTVASIELGKVLYSMFGA